MAFQDPDGMDVFIRGELFLFMLGKQPTTEMDVFVRTELSQGLLQEPAAAEGDAFEFVISGWGAM